MSLFAHSTIAAGYANARPPVHPHIVRRIAGQLGRRVACAIDLGCGAGLSTRPLAAIADVCAGIEPVAGMVAYAGTVAPQAHFIAGQAERLPFRSRSADLITAAGSVNYVDFDAFFPEAARVLTANGQLVIYDFTMGRSFTDSPVLDEWCSAFLQRYPAAKGARPVSPESLAAEQSTLAVWHSERFEVALPFDRERYAAYMMTETNVAQAVRLGEAEDAIRDWCGTTLETVFAGRSHDVVFRGYIAYLTHKGVAENREAVASQRS